LWEAQYTIIEINSDVMENFMPDANENERIAIVGGGITGLFCAYVLAQRDHKKSVFLFEGSNRLGGRIRTIRLDRGSEDLGKKWKTKGLEFYVEFGPMRIELDIQVLVKALLDHLEIKEVKPREEANSKKPHLVPFPAFISPSSKHDPQYELHASESGKSPLDLLRLALLRVMVHLKFEGTLQSDIKDKQRDLNEDIKLAGGTQELVEPIFARWMKELDEGHYWDIQTQGKVDSVPLYAIGFWNLLSDYLSHNAIAKLRDLGTFYHLLPDNPNAAEWLVWWLRGFAISDQLQGVHGGMECIIDGLLDKLKSERGLESINKKQDKKDPALFTGCRVTWLERQPSVNNSNRYQFKIHFDPNCQPKNNQVREQKYDRVILALPTSALAKIVRRSEDAFSSVSETEGFKTLTAFSPEKEQIFGLLDSAFGFAMVKMFVVVKQRWWPQEEHRANRAATQVPTRELHYWSGLTTESAQGLIMAYTDRPASSFWANYVPPQEQIDAHYSNYLSLKKRENTVSTKPDGIAQGKGNTLPPKIADRLIKKVVQYINDTGVPNITPDDILWYGIRDWGREPYGGGNHAWRPERQYWVVMNRLADISGIHICGEAYSDYHGFMEGSLRSAVYVLHRILGPSTENSDERLPWLSCIRTNEKDETKKEQEYFKKLRQWVGWLDKCKKSQFLYPEEREQ
jgi:hypothetical protein